MLIPLQYKNFNFRYITHGVLIYLDAHWSKEPSLFVFHKIVKAKKNIILVNTSALYFSLIFF